MPDDPKQQFAKAIDAASTAFAQQVAIADQCFAEIAGLQSDIATLDATIADMAANLQAVKEERDAHEAKAVEHKKVAEDRGRRLNDIPGQSEHVDTRKAAAEKAIKDAQELIRMQTQALESLDSLKKSVG